MREPTAGGRVSRRWWTAVVVSLAMSGVPAFSKDLELRRSWVLPTDDELHVPVGLSPVEGSEVVLVTAGRKAAAEERGVSWVVWAVEGDSVGWLRTDPAGERPERCVRRSESATFCLLRSQTGRLATGVLDVAKGTLRAQKAVGPPLVETVKGVVPAGDGGLLAWGMSQLRPFATLVDGNGEEKWTIRWSEFGEIGEFYDGIITGGRSRFLARSRTEDGAAGDRFAELEVDPEGTIVRTRRFSHADGRTLPLLVESMSDGGGTVLPQTGEEASAGAPIALLEGGAALQHGLLEWGRLNSETVAHLALEGKTTLLVVTAGAAETVVRAPVKGLPFSALVAGRGGTVWVLTMDVEATATPPRQILRLTRLELIG